MNYKNIKTYGKAHKIRVSRLQILLVVLVICLVTPFTNWLFPIVAKRVNKGIIYNWRYN